MAALLVLLFLVVPILEIWIIVQVGQVIGALPTVALLIVESLIGAWLVRREGRRTWLALQEALRAPRMPGRELLDGGLVLVGGTLLLTPGFATDVVGFFLVLPFTRPLARAVVARLVARRIRVLRPATGRRVPPRPSTYDGQSPYGAGTSGPSPHDSSRARPSAPRVVRGEVVGSDEVGGPDEPPDGQRPGT